MYTEFPFLRLRSFRSYPAKRKGDVSKYIDCASQEMRAEEAERGTGTVRI